MQAGLIGPRRIGVRLSSALVFFLCAVQDCTTRADPLDQPSSPGAAAWAALDLPGPLAHLLESGRWDRTPPGFRIVTLSFLADGCAGAASRDPHLRGAALACVNRAAELAAATRPRDLDVDAANEGLWLSHMNLILGARDGLSPCADPQGHARIARALARRTLAEPTSHVPSFAGNPRRWPADQSATLASLTRFDRAHGSHLADEPVRRWRQTILRGAIDQSLQLPWSEMTGLAVGARVPRGCALSWQTRFVREFDPALAATWWQRYKEAFLVDAAVVVGFREWPPGHEHRADVDSGPIVKGVGAAASALGIAAARSMNDNLLALRLEATAAAALAWTSGNPAVARQTSTALAAAIRFVGKHPYS